MSETGPAKLNLSERLKARSAADLREVEDAIRNEHARLVESLRQSSRDALNEIRTSINAPISEIEGEIAASRNRMRNALAEIEIRPARAMRTVAMVSAGIGAVIAMLPWAVMSYYGVGVIGQTRELIKERAALTEEIEALTARVDRLDQVWVQDLKEGTFLVVPNAGERLFTCGTPPLPCVKLSEE